MKRFYPALAAVAFLLLSLSLSYCSKEVLFAEHPDDFTSKLIGGAGRETGEDIVQGPDGSFYLTGSSSTESNGGSDILVAKLNEIGELLWSRNYGGGEDDIGKAILYGSDGKLWVAGNWGEDICLLGLDAENGGMVNTNVYSSPGTMNTVECLLETTDGFWLAGSQSTLDNRDMYLMKSSPNGTKLWDKSEGGAHHDHGSSLLSFSPQSAWVLGTTYSYPDQGPNPQQLIFQFKEEVTPDSSYGTLAGTELFFTGGDREGIAFSRSGDRLYITGLKRSASSYRAEPFVYSGMLGGLNGSQPGSSSLDSLWEVPIPQNLGLVPTDILALPEGGALVVGTQKMDDDLNTDLVLIQVSPQGGISWLQHFGGEGPDTGGSVIRARDGSIVCVGTQEYDGYAMAWVGRLLSPE